MKARDIVGKRVVAVRQERVPADPDASRPGAWHLRSILFEDGTTLTFSVIETESDYAIEGVVIKQQPS